MTLAMHLASPDTTPPELLALFVVLAWSMFAAVEFAARRNRRREEAAIERGERA